VERLQGKWRCIGTDHFRGEVVKGTKAATPDAAVIVIKGEKIIVPGEGLELPFSLDVNKSPKQIKRTVRYALGNNKFELREWLSIYVLDGDRLTICTLSRPSGQMAPKGFPERGKPAEEEVTVETFERVKDKKR
jgi:uncharacterized protein (TIGR03067 family)